MVENLRDLQAAVTLEGAELGIAFDGDGDRIGAVDERGTPVFGDILLVLFGRDLAQRMGTGHPVIFDVKCSEVLPEELTRAGLVPTMWKTGHSLIKQKMKEIHAPLAGEMSGHMFFGGDWFGFDDALFAAARLLQYIAAHRRAALAAARRPAAHRVHARDPRRLPRRAEVRGRRARGQGLRGEVPGLHARRRAHHASRRDGDCCAHRTPSRCW